MYIILKDYKIKQEIFRNIGFFDLAFVAVFNVVVIFIAYVALNDVGLFISIIVSILLSLYLCAPSMIAKRNMISYFIIYITFIFTTKRIKAKKERSRRNEVTTAIEKKEV